MHVDVGIELIYKRKDTVDLGRVVGIIVWRGAYHLGTTLQRINVSTRSWTDQGLLVRSSCGKTYTLMSMAQA